LLRPNATSPPYFPDNVRRPLPTCLAENTAMSFRDLDSGKKGSGHGSSRQPKQRRDEESPFERNIRSNIQAMQDSVRKVSEKLEQAQRSFFSKRVGESLDKCLEQSHELARQTEQLFREWQVHLAGEPAERHRKKFSIEKLQKAFDEEAAHLKDVAQRAAQTQQEAISAGQCGLSSSGGFECRSICDEQDAGDEDDDCERGLLDDSVASRDQACMQVQAQEQDATIRNRIAQEREEGIKRIQCQVSEVNQIFRDLASIVADQGQQIGSIESQAETTASSTKQAVQELKKAVDRQRGAREKLCCLLATAVLFLCFIILPQMHVLDLHPYSAAGNSLVGQTNAAAGQPGGSPATEPAAGRSGWRPAPAASQSGHMGLEEANNGFAVEVPHALGEPRVIAKTGQPLTLERADRSVTNSASMQLASPHQSPR